MRGQQDDGSATNFDEYGDQEENVDFYGQGRGYEDMQYQEPTVDEGDDVTASDPSMLQRKRTKAKKGLYKVDTYDTSTTKMEIKMLDYNKLAQIDNYQLASGTMAVGEEVEDPWELVVPEMDYEDEKHNNEVQDLSYKAV